MSDTTKRTIISIFPYLCLYKVFNISGITIRPFYPPNFEEEPEDMKKHIEKIASSFALKNGQAVTQFSYAWTKIADEEWKRLKTSIDEFVTIIRYESLADERNGANFSNFDYCFFEIAEREYASHFSYYPGTLNRNRTVEIRYPATKFCPNSELRPFIFDPEDGIKLLSQFLASKITDKNFRNEADQILRALEWFNKSFKEDPEIDNSERFINLAIAFEALFDAPEKEIREALRTGVTSLLGNTLEMKDFINKFYDLRSHIVHGKEEPILLYKARGSSEHYLDTLIFARKVFSRCVKAILTCRKEVYTNDLHSELVSNERRIKEILIALPKLKNTADLYNSRLNDTISSLSQKDISGKSNDIPKIGSLLLPFIKEYLKKKKREDVLEKIKEVTNFKGDLRDLALLYNGLSSAFSSIYFGDKVLSNEKLPYVVLCGSLYHFCSYACWKLLI